MARHHSHTGQWTQVVLTNGEHVPDDNGSYDQIIEERSQAIAAETGRRPDFWMPIGGRGQSIVGFKTVSDYNRHLREVEIEGAIHFKSADMPRDEAPALFGWGSSTLRDVEGDVFHDRAITGMVEKSVDLNVLNGHIKTMPDSLMGGVFYASHGKTASTTGTEHDAIYIGADVQEDNPRAMQTYNYIIGKNCRRRQWGFSVGALYVDVKRRYDKQLGGYYGLDIFDADPLEYSTTPLPANRVCWITYAKKSLQASKVLPQIAEGGWSNPEVRYVLLSREDVVDESDLGTLVNWNNLNKIANYLEKQCGVVLCVPKVYQGASV